MPYTKYKGFNVSRTKYKGEMPYKGVNVSCTEYNNSRSGCYPQFFRTSYSNPI